MVHYVEVTCLNLVLVRIWKKDTVIKGEFWGRERERDSWSVQRRVLHRKGGGSRECSNTFMSSTNCQGIENQCWLGQGGNNTRYNQTLIIIFSVTSVNLIENDNIQLTCNFHGVLGGWMRGREGLSFSTFSRPLESYPWLSRGGRERVRKKKSG